MIQFMRLFLAGGSIYPALEWLYRRKTHISMAFAGGAGLCCIHKVCNGLLKKRSLTVKCMAGSCVITVVEFVTGLVVNVAMKKQVWDYSGLPLNLKGQICLPFTLLWGVLTIPALFLCKLLKCK